MENFDLRLKWLILNIVLFLVQVIDKSFGFDTAVEEAQRAISAGHIESESFENGIGLVKLMGRYSGRLHSSTSYFYRTKMLTPEKLLGWAWTCTLCYSEMSIHEKES